MSKILDVYSKALNEGKDKGLLSADLRILLAHDLGFKTQIEVLYHKDDEISQDNIDLFNSQFARLLNQEPVEYIINEANFLEHKLYVDENVLIPRMETEELVANISERILDYYDPRNYLVVADIGTGSGAIAIALKSLFPSWLLTASDISKPALDIAKRNAEENGTKISFLEGKSLEPYIKANMNLDIIVSNPPYIASKDKAQASVRNFEPSSALWLDKNDSVYEGVLANIDKVKKGTLLICFEIDDDITDFLDGLMDKYLTGIYRYKKEYIKDMNGFDRFLFIFLE